MSIEVKDAPDTGQQLRETVHDMRRPVAAMLALAAAAPTEADLPAAAHSRLEQIVGLAEWLIGIIHGCLAWQEREGPDQTGEPDDGSVDVVPVVTEVAAAERVSWPGEVAVDIRRQSIGRDRVWRDGLSSRFKRGVPGPEGCVAIVRQVCSPGRYTGTKITQSQCDIARRPCWGKEGATDGDLPNLIDAPSGSDGGEWGKGEVRGAGVREHP